MLQETVSGSTSEARQSSSVKHGFDGASGQVFTEREVRFNPRLHTGWIRELKTPTLIKSRQRRGANGARSLLDMARHQVARQVCSLEVEHLAETVPWGVAEGIWKEAVSLSVCELRRPGAS